MLKQGTTTLVGQTDASMTANADMLDSTTKDSTSKGKTFIGGETGWTLSVSGLYDPAAAAAGSVSGAFTDLKAGTAWTIKFGQVTSGSKHWGGSAYIQSVTINGPKNDLASYTLEMQGTAAVTEATS